MENFFQASQSELVSREQPSRPCGTWLRELSRNTFSHWDDVVTSAATNYMFLFLGEADNVNKGSAGEAAAALTIKDLLYICIYTGVQ